MDKNMYDFIDYEEQNHWWFNARANIVKSQILKQKKDIENFLDIGCGSGFFMSKMHEHVENVYGVEPFEYKNIKSENIVRGTAEYLPYSNNYFDCISILDVIEHLENPVIAMDEIYRVLKKDGICVITVPALNFLYSRHDKENGHKKRYNIKDLKQLIDHNKFDILSYSYFNSLLFPIEAPIRLLEKVINKKVANDGTTNRCLNNIFYKIFNSEEKYLRNKTFAIGLSVFIIIQKK